MKYQPPYGSPGTDDPYINGDPSIARQGSILPAAAAEYPQREIVNFIDNSNLVPADNDLEQLTKAARSQWVNFCIDTGAINNLSVALNPPLGEYRQGVPLRVLVKNTNTGATTINVNNLGNRPVVRANGANLEGGDIRANMIALLVDDGTRFQLVNFQGVLATAINNYTIEIPYAQDTGTVNSLIGLYAPPITTAQDGDLVLIKVANKNTGAVMFTVNSLVPVPIRRNDGQPLQANDLELNEILLLVYNVNCWQVLRLVRSQVFFKLNGDMVLYVRTDGNDASGDGSANTADKAFKTVTRAVEYLRDNYLVGRRTVTIQLGIPGTYYGRVGPGELGGVYISVQGRIIVRGDPNNILGYNMQGPSGVPAGQGNVFGASGAGTEITVQGLTFSVAENKSYHVTASANAVVFIDNVALSGITTAGSGLCTVAGGRMYVFNYVHVYSNMNALLFSVEQSTISVGQWYTNFYNHGVSYTTGFAFGRGMGSIAIIYGWANFTGTAYGPKFNLQGNSVIDTLGGPVDFLPGSSSGVVDASSVYI